MGDFERWHEWYINDLEWRDEVIKTLTDLIAYTGQELSDMRSDFNLLIDLLLLDKRIGEGKMEQLRIEASKNIKLLHDPDFIARVQKGHAKIADIFERQVPKGVKI